MLICIAHKIFDIPFINYTSIYVCARGLVLENVKGVIKNKVALICAQNGIMTNTSELVRKPPRPLVVLRPEPRIVPLGTIGKT